jgi:hypothetical protein
LKSGWNEQQVRTALMQLSVPSAIMLDVQLNKLIPVAVPDQVRTLPVIKGDDGCLVCGGDGFLVEYNTDEQQHKSRWCECRNGR